MSVESGSWLSDNMKDPEFRDAMDDEEVIEKFIDYVLGRNIDIDEIVLRLKAVADEC